jgi:hypothetical protein
MKQSWNALATQLVPRVELSLVWVESWGSSPTGSTEWRGLNTGHGSCSGLLGTGAHEQIACRASGVV